jgi:hypothetical protein
MRTDVFASSQRRVETTRRVHGLGVRAVEGLSNMDSVDPTDIGILISRPPHRQARKCDTGTPIALSVSGQRHGRGGTKWATLTSTRIKINTVKATRDRSSRLVRVEVRRRLVKRAIDRARAASTVAIRADKTAEVRLPSGGSVHVRLARH